MSAAPESDHGAPWAEAARVVARWFDRHERIDELMARLPRSLSSVERARCQHLVFGAVRHHGRLEAAIARLLARPPRLIVRAALHVAGYELIEACRPGLPAAPPAGASSASGPATEEAGLVAKIAHHAVERAKALASPAEARMVNAVLRRLAGTFATQTPPPRLDPASALAEYFSHPDWLVRRWLAEFGADATRALLEWNQQPAPVYARWRAEAPPPAWLEATRWPGFFEVPAGRWSEIEPLLAGGELYLQDPAARLAVELLTPRAGELVLDLCAAPGGKSLQIADAMAHVPAAGTPAAQDSSQLTPAPAGRIVAVDLPGERQARLRENLVRIRGVDTVTIEADVAHGLAAALAARDLPVAYRAVLLDVPCTNTGVMRHRVDVKWRLQEGDFARHAHQQLGLLQAAARCVASGGRLVYSTCSLDPEENEHVVKAFLRKLDPQFALEGQELSRPWETGHDGVAAFRLRRKQ